ncbi:hypothetical protein EW145_g1621 [Phellinidium pouzarii]|uniref:Pre-mRNA-splicing factor 38 n=1 Tax=Phellinidium pouzarii TaxID=167371 RepID=A0A4S4LJC0_9AGAM|nr:hypothetical protein EW145_g1621 [Phellinidium pouzarii]
MANTTVRNALSIHGQNPQFLVETIIRNRIYESQFWKEHCFALTAETLIDRAIELNAIGGIYANQKPTEFICLLLKLLQIQPEKEILIEYLQVDEFKYLRALAAMYIRMTFGAVEVYEILEPLLKDFRKLRLRHMGGYTLTYMDEFVDQLLNDERVCDTILPRIPKRGVLEENDELGPRKSLLLDAMDGKSERGRSKSRSRSRSADRSNRSSRSKSGTARRSKSAYRSVNGSRTPSRSGSVSDAGSRYVSRSPSRSRSRSRSKSKSPYRSRSRSISPDRIEADSPPPAE